MTSPTLHSNKPPIGVFDSGVGGLSVLDKLVAAFPDERFVYFGDTLHMPYGTRTADEITRLATGAIRWLSEDCGAKLIVTACNTSAATLYGQDVSPVPLIWTMGPVCEWIARQAEASAVGAVARVSQIKPFYKVGIIATPLTIASGIYGRLIRAQNPDLQVREISCPQLAALIEQGQGETLETRTLLEEYLAPFKAWEPEAVVLGCTHYPFAARLIAEVLPGVPLLDPADTIREKTGQALQLQAWGGSGRVAPVEYHVSAAPEKFQQVARALPLQHLEIPLPRLTVVTSLEPLR